MCFVAGVVLSTNLLAENRGLDSLDDLRWKNRVVLVNDATDRTIGELAAIVPPSMNAT